MSLSLAERQTAERLIHLALAEDLDERGDLTSSCVVPAQTRGQALFVARKPGRLAGLPIAQMVFAQVDPQVSWQSLLADGALLQPGMALARVSGPMRSILVAERTALNFVQRLSGIASLTARYAEQIAGTRAVLLDTRKTTPGWRHLEKYAVRCGGGTNHRLGLYDGVLIKDNHLAALGFGPQAVAQAVQAARVQYGHSVPIEVEVDTLEQLEVALTAEPDIILLDNMPPDLLCQAIARRDAVAPAIRLEASGGVNLDTIAAIAATGIDRISVGALTHSAVALDIGLDYER
ncbi:MAG: carboxylating nicotinate-nucleotide diphosphorylase [Gemmataceae bacterium]